MTDCQSVEDFFAQYEDLAVAVVSDERQNVEIGCDLSNADMCEAICEIMDWDDFDLFDHHDFSGIYNSGATPHVVAYCYLAFLRWELWLAAIENKIGEDSFNDKAAAHSELWFCRLRDRYVALISGEMTTHPWIH